MAELQRLEDDTIAAVESLLQSSGKKTSQRLLHLRGTAVAQDSNGNEPDTTPTQGGLIDKPRWFKDLSEKK